jgi:hypothetical protein
MRVLTHAGRPHHLQWTVISLIVAVKLWRAGRGRPTALIKRLLGSGARAFLTKPLEVAELLALLDEVADEREAADTTPAAADTGRP